MYAAGTSLDTILCNVWLEVLAESWCHCSEIIVLSYLFLYEELSQKSAPTVNIMRGQKHETVR